MAGFNQTGNGTFCLPKMTLPQEVGIRDGAMASLQVVQVGEMGSALYNVSFVLRILREGKVMGTDVGCSAQTLCLAPRRKY